MQRIALTLLLALAPAIALAKGSFAMIDSFEDAHLEDGARVLGFTGSLALGILADRIETGLDPGPPSALRRLDPPCTFRDGAEGESRPPCDSDSPDSPPALVQGD